MCDTVVHFIASLVICVVFKFDIHLKAIHDMPNKKHILTHKILK